MSQIATLFNAIFTFAERMATIGGGVKQYRIVNLFHRRLNMLFGLFGVSADE